MQRLLVPLFTFIWWKRLINFSNEYYGRYHVYKVKNWRTAILDGYPHGRHIVSFCFWWFK